LSASAGRKKGKNFFSFFRPAIFVSLLSDLCFGVFLGEENFGYFELFSFISGGGEFSSGLKSGGEKFLNGLLVGTF